jgi:hypothetical protein
MTVAHPGGLPTRTAPLATRRITLGNGPLGNGHSRVVDPALAASQVGIA